MLDATAIREFLCRSVWERDAILSALVVDAGSPELQQEITAWHKGSLTGLFPSGETRRLLGEFRPASGAGECRQAYQRANADVLRANLGAHLCPKLEALMVAHNAILDEASEACEQSFTQIANLESHCQAATDLIDIILVYEADPPEGEGKSGNNRKSPSPSSTNKRRGRRKAGYEKQQEDAALVEKWERAKENGVYKPKFAKDQGLTSQNFQKLLNRVAKRKSRSDK